MIFFIPARKNSKRLPNKNMYPIAGKSLIQWTFDEIKNLNKEQDCVVVSTDDDTVARLALEYGFTIFERPKNLCLDDTKMSDVLFYHVPDFELLHEQHDIETDICVLYPTNPLRTIEQIKNAMLLWKNTERLVGNSIMSVEEINYRPYGLMKIEDTFLRCNVENGYQFYQAQGQPESYRANGAIYIFSLEDIKNKTIDAQLFTRKTMPFQMDKISSLEIDDMNDIEIVESILIKKQALVDCRSDMLHLASLVEPSTIEIGI